MRYVIMADGKGSRWHHYMGREKHEIAVGGETLLQRTVRLIRSKDPTAEVIITSHNPAYEVEGSTRYEPKNNIFEIDRFTAELIDDDVCFLYGDVFYSDETLDSVILNRGYLPVVFFGGENSICAVLIRDGEAFRRSFLAVRALAESGEMPGSKGWQVYHHFAGMPLEGRKIGEYFIRVDNSTRDFNSPEDYSEFLAEK